MHGQQKTKFRR